MPYTDQELLDYSKEHLRYEFQIFRWVVDNLPKERGFRLSVALESFAVHLRNLIDFFYPPQNLKDDDVIAAHFFDSPDAWDLGSIPKSLSEARERANKEISHITFKRKAAADPTKPWPVTQLFHEIQAISKKFASEASNKKLHESVRKFLNAEPEAVRTALVAASAGASNTAVGLGSAGAGAASSAKATGVPVGLGGSGPGNRSTQK